MPVYRIEIDAASSDPDRPIWQTMFTEPYTSDDPATIVAKETVANQTVTEPPFRVRVYLGDQLVAEAVETDDDGWQQYKDDLAQGYIHPDGTQRDMDPPDCY